jgi:hypothetical protein
MPDDVLDNVTLTQTCLSLGRVSTGRLRDGDFFLRRQRCLRLGRPECVFGDRSPSTTASFGEHFAAWEQPKLFAEEIRARFRSMPVDEMEVEARRNHLRFQTSKSRKAGTLALLWWPLGSSTA